MADITPFEPYRPLIWSDFVYELQDFLLEQEIAPVYIVGGGVRDALLGLPQKDLDLTTGGDSIAVARKIANHFRGDVYVMDAQRGVARVLLHRKDGLLILDVARFRADDLLGDLQDRDFTVNAMAVNLMSDLRVLIDPMNGVRDLQDKIIRRCSPNAIAADPLRGLRAIRQCAQLDFHLDKETRDDIKAVLPAFSSISAERVRDEFMKLLSGAKVSQPLNVARVLGLMDLIVPETAELHKRHLTDPANVDVWSYTTLTAQYIAYMIGGFLGEHQVSSIPSSFGFGSAFMQLGQFKPQLKEHLMQRWADERPHRSLLALAALLHYVGADKVNQEQSSAEITARVAVDLRLSNDEKERLLTIVRYIREPLLLSGNLTPVSIYRFWRKTGPAGVDICLLSLVAYLAAVRSYIDRDSWLSLLEGVRHLLEAYYLHHEMMVSPPMLLDGNQLMEALGLTPGPHIGELLESIREAQVTGEVKTREDALDYVRSRL